MNEHELTIKALERFMEQYKKLKAAGHNERGIAEALGFTQLPRFREFRWMAYRVLQKLEAKKSCGGT